MVSSTPPDLQIGVDVGREPGVQLDALAPDGAETRQRERHRVGAGPQVDDLVPAVRVGDDGPDLFDERRARRFDGHAGQHGPGRILRTSPAMAPVVADCAARNGEPATAAKGRTGGTCLERKTSPWFLPPKRPGHRQMRDEGTKCDRTLCQVGAEINSQTGRSDWGKRYVTAEIHERRSAPNSRSTAGQYMTARPSMLTSRCSTRSAFGRNIGTKAKSQCRPMRALPHTGREMAR